MIQPEQESATADPVFPGTRSAPVFDDESNVVQFLADAWRQGIDRFADKLFEIFAYHPRQYIRLTTTRVRSTVEALLLRGRETPIVEGAMKSLEFFSRTYTEPGGSAFHPNSQPLTQVARSRVVYLMYPEDRAVVYSGIDEGVPTKVAARQIINLILAAEKFDPSGWSFFDLVTDLQGSNGPDEGDEEFHLISWRPGQQGVDVEGSILLDCPARVLEDFARFIGCPPNTDPNILLSGISVSLTRDRRPTPQAPESKP